MMAEINHGTVCEASLIRPFTISQNKGSFFKQSGALSGLIHTTFYIQLITNRFRENFLSFVMRQACVLTKFDCLEVESVQYVSTNNAYLGCINRIQHLLSTESIVHFYLSTHSAKP